MNEPTAAQEPPTVGSTQGNTPVEEQAEIALIAEIEARMQRLLASLETTQGCLCETLSFLCQNGYFINNGEMITFLWILHHMREELASMQRSY